MIPFWLNPARLLDLAPLPSTPRRRPQHATHTCSRVISSWPHANSPTTATPNAAMSSHSTNHKRVKSQSNAFAASPTKPSPLPTAPSLSMANPSRSPTSPPQPVGQGATATCNGQLGPDEYILLGDNRSDSLDSRAYGPVPRSAIIGRAWYRYAPSARSGPLHR